MMKLYGNYKGKGEKRKIISSKMVSGVLFLFFFNWAIESSAVHSIAVQKKSDADYSHLLQNSCRYLLYLSVCGAYKVVTV